MKPFDQKARRFQIITKNAQLSFSVQSGLWGLSEYVGLRRKRRTDTLLDSRHSFQLFRPCHSCYFFDKSLFPFEKTNRLRRTGRSGEHVAVAEKQPALHKPLACLGITGQITVRNVFDDFFRGVFIAGKQAKNCGFDRRKPFIWLGSRQCFKQQGIGFATAAAQKSFRRSGFAAGHI